MTVRPGMHHDQADLQSGDEIKRFENTVRLRGMLSDLNATVTLRFGSGTMTLPRDTEWLLRELPPEAADTPARFREQTGLDFRDTLYLGTVVFAPFEWPDCLKSTRIVDLARSIRSNRANATRPTY